MPELTPNYMLYLFTTNIVTKLYRQVYLLISQVHLVTYIVLYLKVAVREIKETGKNL